MKAAQPEAVAATRVNPGETLRKARENNNWSQAEVAQKLNLSVLALSQLESGSFDKLPGHTFARGYIRAYAKLLGMDQNSLVQDFDQFTGTDARGSSVHALGRIEEPVRLSQSVLRFFSVAVLAVLAAISFFWWQDQSNRTGAEAVISSALEHVEVESADGTTQIHPLDEPEDQAVAEGQASPDAELAEVTPEVAAQPEATPPAMAVEPLVSVPPAPVVANPLVAPAAPIVAAAPVVAAPVAPAAVAAPVAAPTEAAALVPAPGEGLVSVQFSANCWAQLTDANGKVLFSALKRKGESLELVGKAPLELRLGFASGAHVSYNGQAVDVAPYTSGETARMKLGL